MPARRTERPYLFGAVATEVAPAAKHELPPKPDAPTTEASPLRYLLPKDLAGALTRLSDAEIDALLATVTREAERRGRLPKVAMPTETSAEGDRLASSASRTKPKRQAQVPPSSTAPALTLGQTNAVRAAFLAGVKPSTIARQFGISQTAVKQALSTEIRRRK